MATIATDGKGNYITQDDSGNWVPTAAPEPEKLQGGNRFTDAPPDTSKPPPIDFATRQAGPPPSLDELGLSLPQGGDTGAVGRIGTAAVRGYQETPPLLSPAVRQQEESTAFGNFVLSPINQLIGAGAGIIGGAGAAIGQGAYEVGNALGGPALGRDFYMGSQTPIEPAPNYLRMPAAQEVPKFVSDRTAPPRALSMTDAERIQQLVEHSVNMEQPTVGPPMARGPLTEEAPPPQPTAGETAPPGAATAPATPAPQPAGAQITPATELGLTPREEAAYRSTAEGQKLLEPQEPGVRDDKTYLTGERINEAEASQDVEVARKLKSLREQTPALDKQMTADENHNNNIRTNAINNTIPGQVQINAAKTAREDAMKAAEPKVFENATDADVRPIVQHLQEVVNDPKNLENTQLQQYVRPLIDRLQNPDGTPKITNARQLWGWRQDVQHLTSGAAQATDRNLTRVSGVLGGVLEVTDDAIEGAAPGYKAQLRDDYRNRSREIDAMEALNAERFKLFDSQNKPNYNAVQGLMRRITDARQSNDPYDAYTHVSQDMLDKLWNIRDTMRRTAAVDRLGGTRGSPTSQNLGDALRAAGRMAVQNAAPAIGAGIGAFMFPDMPMVAPTGGLIAGTAVNHLLSERAMGQRLQQGLPMLNVNTLMQPPSP